MGTNTIKTPRGGDLELNAFARPNRSLRMTPTTPVIYPSEDTIPRTSEHTPPGELLAVKNPIPRSGARGLSKEWENRNQGTKAMKVGRWKRNVSPRECCVQFKVNSDGSHSKLYIPIVSNHCLADITGDSLSASKSWVSESSLSSLLGALQGFVIPWWMSTLTSLRASHLGCRVFCRG